MLKRDLVTASVKCPACGTLRTRNTIQGLCSGCLAGLVIDAEDDASLDEESETTGVAVGSRFGHYEIIEQIAQGGMGVVFKARQLALNRVVAIKMVRGERLTRQQDILRFRAEAEAAAQLHHRGIVAIHEVGQDHGQHFYSMDYVEGHSLEEITEQAPLPLDRAARYIRDVARAIHYAHTRGVIHRDLKPSNILVDENGEPRVTDFGLAKVMQADTGLTVSGTVMGSPSYMSPEQAGGRTQDVGVESDVYALGAILYKMATGVPPFEGETTVETIRKVVENDPVSPRALNQDVPRDLETVCLKCLDKTPARRYRSAEHLAEELDRFLNNEPIHARRISRPERLWRWCRRKPALAGVTAFALMIFIAGIGGVLWQWRNAEFERRQGRERLLRLNLSTGLRHMQEGDLLSALPWLVEALSLERPGQRGEENARIRIGSILDRAPRLLQLWLHDVMLTWADFSPDGRLVVLAGRDGTARICDVNTGASVGAPLRHPQAIFMAVFSPDGERLLTTCADQSVLIWNVRTGRLSAPPLKHGPRDRGDFVHGAFSPDGRRIATVAGDKTARLWDAETGREIIPPIQQPAAGAWVAFHPDGTRFVTTSGGEITARSTATGQVVGTPMRHPRPVVQVKFSPDGSRMVSAARDGTALIWNPQTGEQVGAPLRHAITVNSVEFSPDGRYVATTSYDQTARVWDAATGLPVTPWLRHMHSVVQVSFSPDGRCVLTTSHDHTARIWDIASGEVVQTFRHNGFVVRSRFSPDGRRIITAGQDQIARLWDIETDVPVLPPFRHGTNAILAVTFNPAGDKIASAGEDGTACVWEAATANALFRLPHQRKVNSVAFSPDGATLLTTSDDRSACLWSASDGRLLHRMEHKDKVRCGVFSPDGTRIATGSDDRTAMIWDTSTGKPLTLPMEHSNGLKCVAFSPDGRTLATGSSAARLWDSATGRSRSDWLPHDDAEVRHVAFSPDGRKLATACSDAFDPYIYPQRAGQVWDVHTGARITPPLQHTDGVLYCVFTPDGTRVITTSEDGAAKIWDANTGALLTAPLRHRKHVLGAQLTPDGSRVFTWGTDGTARMWEVASGQPVIPPIRSIAEVLRAALSPDGLRIAIGANDGFLRVWKTSSDQRTVEQLRLFATVLTGQRLDPLSGPTPLESAALHRAWLALRRPEQRLTAQAAGTK